jgi:hypothetical protein
MQPPRAAKHQRKRADYSRSHAYLRPPSAQIQARPKHNQSQAITDQQPLEPIRVGSWEDVVRWAAPNRWVLSFALRFSDDGDSQADWVCASLLAHPVEIHQLIRGGVEACLKSLDFAEPSVEPGFCDPLF